MTPARRLTLDPIACTGHGVCAELAPEFVDLDDWGYPRITAGALPPYLMRTARRAVSACPALALQLQPIEKPPRNLPETASIIENDNDPGERRS